MREQRVTERVEHEHAPSFGGREGVVAGAVGGSGRCECAHLPGAEAAQVLVPSGQVPLLAVAPYCLFLVSLERCPLGVGGGVLGGEDVAEVGDERERRVLLPEGHRALHHLEALPEAARASGLALVDSVSILGVCDEADGEGGIWLVGVDRDEGAVRVQVHPPPQQRPLTRSPERVSPERVSPERARERGQGGPDTVRIGAGQK